MLNTLKGRLGMLENGDRFGGNINGKLVFGKKIQAKNGMDNIGNNDKVSKMSVGKIRKLLS